jgi:hypothetical protein
MAQKGNVRRQQVTLTVLIVAKDNRSVPASSTLVGGYFAIGNS